MGNIATTGEDLSRFFYDIFNQTAFVNATTLARMQQWHRLRDTWCFGPGGARTLASAAVGLANPHGHCMRPRSDRDSFAPAPARELALALASLLAHSNLVLRTRACR